MTQRAGTGQYVGRNGAARQGVVVGYRRAETAITVHVLSEQMQRYILKPPARVIGGEEVGHPGIFLGGLGPMVIANMQSGPVRANNVIVDAQKFRGFELKALAFGEMHMCPQFQGLVVPFAGRVAVVQVPVGHRQEQAGEFGAAASALHCLSQVHNRFAPFPGETFRDAEVLRSALGIE